MEYSETTTKYKIERVPFPVMKKAVNDLVDFVKPTFGPSQNKILISDEISTYMIDDGVRIAEKFGSNDQMENAVIEFIKATAQKTNSRVGDGTTGSLIVLQAIINNLPEIFDSLAVIKELKKGVAKAKEILLEKKQEIVTREELKAVAEVSCNDPKLAEIISELMFAVGLDGTIAIEQGGDMEVTQELTEGMQIERGAVSRYMLPEDKKEITLFDPKIILCDRKLGMKETRPMIEKLIQLPEQSRNMLLIANDFDEEVQDFIGRIRLQGLCTVVGIRSPGFGPEATENLKDIAALVETRIIDEKTNIGEVTMATAGGAKKVTINETTTLILEGFGKPETRIEELKAQYPESQYDQQKLKDRIAKLVGKVALIKVGALTEEEAIATYEKVEDAVNATRVAYKGGVVSGAGTALAKLETGSKILDDALKAPLVTLSNNIAPVEGLIINEDEIRDPVEVLIAGLESAVSIACMLISNKGILVTYRDKR